MYHLSDEELTKKGAIITTREIQQQPRLWQEAFDLYTERKEAIESFLTTIKTKHSNVRVIFTGAGTSAYVGDTVIAYLKSKVDEKQFDLQSVPTTDIVSNPYEFYNPEIPTLLVSFARSGNSPESVAAVQLGQQLIPDFYQLTITCAAEGKLAINSKGDDKNLLLLMPEDSNDKGFAMTGSYSCMALTTLLVFDSVDFEQKKSYVEMMSQLGNEVVANETQIQSLVDLDFNRVVYLGSGSLAGLTREAQLKILELTAGKIATIFDSSMGFRHGPKSFVDEKTIIFGFVSNNEYTRQYDLDILEEVAADEIAEKVCAITVKRDTTFSQDKYEFTTGETLPDAYLALPYVMFAQTVSVMASLKVGNTPDTPSPTGTVNRVVQGVKIHSYSN